MTDSCLIDSNLWHLAYTHPADPALREAHERAAAFITRVLSDPLATIAMSSYQLAEVMELFRKSGLSPSHRNRLFAGFLSPKFRLVETSSDHVKHGVQLSLASGIHLYDYLVALPLRGVVTVIYSADDHFQHTDFQAIAPVSNPLALGFCAKGARPFAHNARLGSAGLRVSPPPHAAWPIVSRTSCSYHSRNSGKV